MKLSIIIPCYNEEKNLPLLLDGFSNSIKRNDLEVVLVNNGSTDGSVRVLKELAPKYPFLFLVDVPVNRGYGYGILEGLRVAHGEYIGWTHGDFQTPPEDVIKAFELIEGANFPRDIYIKGLRNGRPFFDVFFTISMSVFESIYLGTVLYDINAQPNIFHRSFFETWIDPPYDFSLDLYAFYLAKKINLKIIRFPVVFKKRIHGESHWNKSFADKWKFIKRTIDFSIKLKKRLQTDRILKQ